VNLTRLSERNHYQVLNVPYDADSDTIQKAYDDAKMMYGHDALVAGTILSDAERRSTFHRISEAYQTLIREDSRKSYDRDIGLEERPSRFETGSGVRSLLADGSRSEPLPRGSPRDMNVSRSGTRNPEVSVTSPGLGSAELVSPVQLGLKEEASGDFLRRARESLGVELAAISQETKIGRSMLEYIEQERLDRLPAPVYLRNFTQQIARCLGLDEEKVSRTYLARIRRLQADRDRDRDRDCEYE
jgi:curved DNA-binding protein CbpA